MTTRRFYCKDLTGEQATVDRHATAHARRSLRLGVGDSVELFDGAGHCARGVIAAAGLEMQVELTERWDEPAVRPVVEIAAAAPKGARAEMMVEKLSELGVARWWPLVTARSVVQPRPGKWGRFERIAVSAARQCGRSHVMAIGAPVKLAVLVARADHEQRWMADCGGNGAGAQPTGATAGSAVQKMHGAKWPTGHVFTIARDQRWLVLIGPEGGWTDEERRCCAEAGFGRWRLGPHVMRIETAAVAAAAIVMQQANKESHP